MNKTNEVTIDQSGRLSLPKEIRTRLGLSPGTKLSVEADDKEIRLRLLPEEATLVNKGGVLVVQSQAVGTLEGIERQERDARLDDLVQRVRF